jgi:hypothetical protein
LSECTTQQTMSQNIHLSAIQPNRAIISNHQMAQV